MQALLYECLFACLWSCALTHSMRTDGCKQVEDRARYLSHGDVPLPFVPFSVKPHCMFRVFKRELLAFFHLRVEFLSLRSYLVCGCDAAWREGSQCQGPSRSVCFAFSDVYFTEETSSLMFVTSCANARISALVPSMLLTTRLAATARALKTTLI